MNYYTTMCDLNIMWEGKGEEVKLAGGFNNWQGEMMEKIGEGLWQKKVSIDEGDFRVNYVFIVDGEWMTADNPTMEKDEGGEMKCRFTVKKEEPLDEEVQERHSDLRKIE